MPKQLPRRPAPDCDEATFQRAVVRLLLHFGYYYMHIPKSFQRGRWMTHVQGDPGYSDLTAIHPTTHDHLLLELKSAKGRLRPGQQEWIDAAGQGHGYILRPADWDALLIRLRKGSDGSAQERYSDQPPLPELGR